MIIVKLIVIICVWELFNLESYNDYKMNRFNESVVTDKANDLIQKSAQNKQNIVISDTNLMKNIVMGFIKKLEDLGYDVELKVFEVEFFDALKRNDKRVDKFVPELLCIICTDVSWIIKKQL